jgi:two-component system, OmpR family, KDP operon response regulator KdpE
MKILIADDDPQILRALRITLTAKGHQIFTATNGAEALEVAAAHQPDLLMVDLGMPELDGIQVIKEVRTWSAAPILVISGRTAGIDKVEALDAGADDYMIKPFSIDEALARIRALTTRSTTTALDEPVVRLGNITIDLTSHTAFREAAGRKEKLRFTRTEWRLLEVLIHHPGEPVSRQHLLTSIWGSEHVSDSGYLRVYIGQLRKKLEPRPAAPRYLLAEAGMTYRLRIDDGPRQHSPAESA